MIPSPVKIFRRFLIVCLCSVLALMGLVAVFYAVEDWRGAHAWAAAQRFVREQGGTTDYAAVIPPPIPDDQNLAMAPLFAKMLAYHVDPQTRQLTFDAHPMDHRLDGMQSRSTNGRGWERGRPADLAARQKLFRADKAFPHTPDPQSPAADVRLALSRYSPLLAELAQAAADRPRSRFPINWTQPSPYMIALPQGNILQLFATTLNLRASAELADGDTAAALADIALVFRLSDALQYDSLLIDHLVNITILSLVAQPIWDGLAARRWDANELIRLQTALAREDVLTDYAHAMRCEEASTGRGLDSLEHHGDGKDILRLLIDQEPTNLSFQERMFYWFVGVAPRGWYDQNKACAVRYEQTHLLGAVDPAAHRVFPKTHADGIAARKTVLVGPYTLFFLLGESVYDILPPRSARMQAVCDQEVIACALERFYLDHQTYPDALAALVPAYLERVPPDVIDGAPMRYRRTPDGRYLLYSIGWNGRDDGGQVAWKEGSQLDNNEGDWVWQYQPLDPHASIQRSK